MYGLPGAVRSVLARAGLAAIVFATGTAGADTPKGGGGTQPGSKVYPCAGQLTRPADLIITMEANKAFYKNTVTAAPVTTQPVFEGTPTMTKAEAQAIACKRRVIEVRVPSSTSSGCADCYPNAEIHVCAAQFSGSKAFEEHCRVPISSTSKADCKTFTHPVEVFKKASGAKNFTLTALKSFRYTGFIDSTGCRVAAKNLGQIHDTAEVYANVTPPASGMDVYRVLTLPSFKGSLLESVIFIEFEKQRR